MESVSKIVSANVSTEPFCEHAASSSQNSLSGDSSLVCSLEEDVPGASQNRREPSTPCSGTQGLVRELCCYYSWEEAGPCESVRWLYNSVKMIYLSNINLHCGFVAVFVITILLAWMLKLWTLMLAYTQVIYKQNLKTKSHQHQMHFLWKDGHLVCSSFHFLILAAFIPT